MYNTVFIPSNISSKKFPFSQRQTIRVTSLHLYDLDLDLNNWPWPTHSEDAPLYQARNSSGDEIPECDIGMRYSLR